MRDARTMTEAEFAAVRRLLRISDQRINVAHAHLVEKKSLRAVAQEFDCSHQAVSKACGIVWTTFEKYRSALAAEDQTASIVPPGWERVTLVAPTHLIQIFREEIAAAAESRMAITLTPNEDAEKPKRGRKKTRNDDVPG